MTYRETVTGYDYDKKDAVERILDPDSGGGGSSGQLEHLQDRVDTLTEVLARFILLVSPQLTCDDLNTLAGYKRFEVVE
jgi:hypothetical protein